MCRHCLEAQMPERGNFCSDSGCYLLNFKSCHACGKKDVPKSVEKTKEGEDGDEETVSFKHVCASCSHVISEHNYSFKIEDGYQLFEMNCQLCGWGESSHSVKPYDPRKINEYDKY